MARRDYFNDPNAPAANSVVPSVVAAVRNDEGEVRQQFSICFTARPVGGHLTTSSESREVIWIDPAKIDRLNVHPSMRLRIDHALAALPRPYVG